ncbi:MAG: hypothetical protein ACOCW7_03950 [Bacteroidota bacterium]
MRYILIFLFTLFLWGCSNPNPNQKENTNKPEKAVYLLENSEILLEITQRGGMYTRFELKNTPLNPFGWKLKPGQMPENNQPYVFRGHFLCTGRWGAPSPGEIKSGIPHNGEVNTEKWEVTNDTFTDQGNHLLKLYCEAPIEKLHTQREILFPDKNNVFVVRETFINDQPIARLSNFVQHATIAPPFLTENTRISTNAAKGFDQRAEPGTLNNNDFNWPNALLQTGEKVDLRNTNTENGFVVTHLFNKKDEISWITAYAPEKKILLGFVFKTKDYPWLNYWQHYPEGQPFVKGLEFGTTGLGADYRVLLSEDTHFHGKPSYIFMDAGERLQKTWMGFQYQLEENTGDVENITLKDQYLSICFQEGKCMDFPIDKEIFQFFMQ